jgi:hypothetical protein
MEIHMRDLETHPVTLQEKVNLLESLIGQAVEKMEADHIAGDMEVVILQEILADVGLLNFAERLFCAPGIADETKIVKGPEV